MSPARVEYELALKFTVIFSVFVVLAYFTLIGLAFYYDKRDKKVMQAQQLMTLAQSQLYENLSNITGNSWLGRSSEI